MKLSSPYILRGSIDTSITNALLACIQPSDWTADDYRKAMVPHTGEYSSIMLRHSREYSNDSLTDTPVMPRFTASMKPILERLKSMYTVNNYVAFIARLAPGSAVDMHWDTGDFLETTHRVHIPLATNSEARYVFDDAAVQMQVGSIYEIDNQRRHGVVNKGGSDRTHLIVNVYGAPL